MKRRDWIITAAVLTAGTMRAPHTAGGPPTPAEPRRPSGEASATSPSSAGSPGEGQEGEGQDWEAIDTHTHFYDPTRPQGVPWPPENSELHRVVLPDDWLRVAAPVGVRRTVVVEASQWVEDNQWVLDLADREPAIVGLVGNLDPHDEAFSRHLRRFAEHPRFRGIRWRHDLVRIDRDRERVTSAARELADRGLSLDLNGPCEWLPAVARLATDVPSLRIVVNHVGASGDPRSPHPAWRQNIRTVAARPNVTMKVSGMVEQVRGEAGEAPDDPAFYRPILDHLWESFGPDRLIFGSNWPVSDRGGDYATVVRIVDHYFRDRGDTNRQKFFEANARRVYGLGAPHAPDAG